MSTSVTDKMVEALRCINPDSEIMVFAALFNAGFSAEDICLHMDEAMEEARKQLDRANRALGI